MEIRLFVSTSEGFNVEGQGVASDGSPMLPVYPLPTCYSPPMHKVYFVCSPLYSLDGEVQNNSLQGLFEERTTVGVNHAMSTNPGSYAYR